MIILQFRLLIYGIWVFIETDRWLNSLGLPRDKVRVIASPAARVRVRVGLGLYRLGLENLF